MHVVYSFCLILPLCISELRVQHEKSLQSRGIQNSEMRSIYRINNEGSKLNRTFPRIFLTFLWMEVISTGAFIINSVKDNHLFPRLNFRPTRISRDKKLTFFSKFGKSLGFSTDTTLIATSFHFYWVFIFLRESIEYFDQF